MNKIYLEGEIVEEPLEPIPSVRIRQSCQKNVDSRTSELIRTSQTHQNDLLAKASQARWAYCLRKKQLFLATSSGQTCCSFCRLRVESWSFFPHSTTQFSRNVARLTESWSTNCQPFQLSWWLQLLTQLWCAKLLMKHTGLGLQKTSWRSAYLEVS